MCLLLTLDDFVPSGRTNLSTGGPRLCCAGPTLPPLSLRPQTQATVPCSMTTATCHHPWVQPVLTPPPTPTRPARETPIGCCPVRTRGVRRRTSASKNGYVLWSAFHSTCEGFKMRSCLEVMLSLSWVSLGSFDTWVANLSWKDEEARACLRTRWKVKHVLFTKKVSVFVPHHHGLKFK